MKSASPFVALVVVAAAAMLALFSLSGAAHSPNAAAHSPNANLFVVNDPGDQIIGHCPATPTVKCTYRAALTAVNEQRDSTPIVIQLPPSTITIAMKPLPEVQLQHGATAKSVHIAGDPANRTTLDGAYQFQLAYIHKGISVNFTNVDFVRGAAPGTGAGKYANYQNGGSLINDGGVMRVVNASFRDSYAKESSGAIHNTNAGQLHVEHATFTNCTAHSGGAISSTSTMSTSTNTLATIVDANFSDNHATGSCGAIQHSGIGARLEIINCSFFNHSAGGSGGTLQNTGGSTMVLDGCTFDLSTATNGGILSNDERGAGKPPNVVEARRCSFTRGNATQFQGGAVANLGIGYFEECHFADNEAHNKDSNPQGAAIAVSQHDASATLVNCTFNASHMGSRLVHKPGCTLDQSWCNSFPSEIYVANKNATLNLTFVTMTNCHNNSLYIDKNSIDKKVTVRGSSLCEDAPIKPGTIRDDLLPHIDKCADADDDTWLCGVKATCTDAAKGAGFGVSCDCPTALKPGDGPTQLWGFAYGGDEDIIPGSAGFAGCFEQWAAQLSGIGADVCAPVPGAAPFGPATTDATCCVPQHVTNMTVTAVADTSEHCSVDDGATSSDDITLNMTLIGVQDVYSYEAQSFETNATVPPSSYENTTEYNLTVVRVAGDVLCTPGETGPCLDPTGDLFLCDSYNASGKIALYPIDLYNGTTDCADGPAAAPSCGTYSWGGKCECAPCVAHHKYACACDGADGTIKCNELGELGTCDCDTPYVVAPPSPPPGAPPEAGMTLAQVLLDIVLPLSIAIGCGAVVGMILRHRALHQARLRRAYDQLLNAGTVRPQGSDEDTNSGTRSGDYTPAR